MDQPDYRDTLCRYFEEEIEGEGYFLELAERSSGHEAEKLRLLAAVEREAANSVVPLLDRHGLVPRPDAELLASGRRQAQKALPLDWPAFIDDMVRRYPDYMPAFTLLERLGPDEDQPALRRLTEHEVEVIDFAGRERAGDPASTAPLLRYLEGPAGGSTQVV